MKNSAQQFALEILNGKKIQFSQIRATEFPKDAEMLFESKDVTLARKGNELFISAIFTGQIKNSLLFIQGVQGFRKLDAPACGKTEIKNFPSYVPKNPIPVDKILGNQKNAPILINKEENPAGYLTQLHQQLHQTPPQFSEPYFAEGEWCIDLDVNWGQFWGSGSNQKIARQKASRFALEAHDGNEVTVAEKREGVSSKELADLSYRSAQAEKNANKAYQRYLDAGNNPVQDQFYPEEW